MKGGWVEKGKVADGVTLTFTFIFTFTFTFTKNAEDLLGVI